MPIPLTPFTVHGGCNCNAIRYRISIPALSSRPMHNPTDATPLPFVATDHCNDCRRATSSLLPTWLCCTPSMVSFALLRRSDSTLARTVASRPAAPDAATSTSTTTITASDWLPSDKVLAAKLRSPDKAGVQGQAEEGHEVRWLTFFESSKGSWRWFCARCGCPVAFTAVRPEGWPDRVDIALGTVDREDLDGEVLVPERQLWWDCGVGWVKEMSDTGLDRRGLPKHPSYDVKEDVE